MSTRRNRNHMKATTVVRDNGQVTTFKFRSTVGGFARCVRETGDWLGFTDQGAAGPRFRDLEEVTTDEDEALGLAVQNATFEDRNTGQSERVQLRTSWVS